ncbi:hypothetical protein KKF84_05245, partial [Myxococcota bacterium]|nr:hypothetical protein [Myxococcota bacterium]MBU1534703.1 hypothetical protein [Myxococcota bacterium]
MDSPKIDPELLINMEQLLETINTGVAVYDVINDGSSGDDYIVVYFNRMALEHEARTMEEISGKSLKDLRPSINEYGLIPIFQK